MIFRPMLIERILIGEKTVTRRPIPPGSPKACRYESGHVYAIQPGMARPAVARVEVLRVNTEPLGSIDDDDAVREGFANRAQFVAYWRDLYGGTFDADALVRRIEFRVTEVLAMVCPSCDGSGVEPIAPEHRDEFLEHLYPTTEGTR